MSGNESKMAGFTNSSPFPLSVFGEQARLLSSFKNYLQAATPTCSNNLNLSLREENQLKAITSKDYRQNTPTNAPLCKPSDLHSSKEQIQTES
jgi:hypothetical protein